MAGKSCGRAAKRGPGCLSAFYAKKLSGTAGEVQGVLRRGFPREEEVMLFADWLGDFLGNACLLVIVIGGLIFWALGDFMKKAKDVVDSEEFKDGVRMGLWAWFGSDDYDDDDWDDDD
jgi:hypothetical protein